MRKSLSEGAKALRLSVSLALAAGLASTAPAVVAQDEAAALEQRVQVTGSRIKRVDVETTSPVTVVTSEQIMASGLQNVGDVLRNLNQADALGLSNVTSSTNANDGSQTISLRGLGPARTLVLVNGRRWLAMGGTSTAGAQVDLTQIPVALIQRVEVLGDGASAIYGSDAIAGVINIILRDDYDGLEVDMGMGGNFEGDGEYRSYGITLGVNGSRSQLSLNLNKVEQNPIWSGDRDISAVPVFGVPEVFGSAFGEYGLFFAPSYGTLCLNPDADQNITNPADRTPQDFIPFGNACRFNYAPTNNLLTPSDRLTAFAGGHYDVTDTTRAFFNFTFNQRKSSREIAAVPLVSGFSGPQWNIPISVDNVYNPFGEDVTGSGFRMSMFGGGRRAIQDYDTYFLTTGLEGSLTLADRLFDWDFSFSRGESSRTEFGHNYVNLLNLRRGLGPSHIDPTTGVPTCGTLADPTPVHGATPCVPINMFSGVTGWTQEMLDYVSTSLIGNDRSGLTGWEVNTTGQIIDLPAGPLAFAAGFERRSSTFERTPDTLIYAGLASDNYFEPTNAEQVAEEFYIEFAVPLVRDAPLARTLELTVAGRFSEFTNEGLIGDTFEARDFDNNSYKFGILWQPHDDLLIRASRGDTFRAPSVTNLYAGGQEGFIGGIDHCSNAAFLSNPYASLTADQQARCHAQGVPVGGAPQQTSQIRQLSGGNPNLLPEQGTTTTVGFVYNPGFVQGLDLSVDVWRVELQDALSFQGVNAILTNCILLGDTNFCPASNPNQFIQRLGSGEVETVRGANFNLQDLSITGVDFSVNYRMQTDGFGSFNFGLNTSYTHEALIATGTELSESVNLVGRALGAFGWPTWKWRGNFTTNWMYGDFGATWAVRYMSPLLENCPAFYRTAFTNGLADFELCSNPNDAWIPNFNSLDADGNPNTLPGHHRIGSHVYHDISGSWRAPWNATVRAGVRNVFDKSPPFMITPFANSFDHAYDLPGPFWFVSYRQSL